MIDIAPRGPVWWRRPELWLAVVAVAHGALPLILLGAHWSFGVDETVYLSQVNAHVPPGFFSAPRARGTTLVAAPVTLLTGSVAAVRVWLAGLSGLALFASFLPWLRLWRGPVVPLAALLFSTIWPVAYYAFEAMPNEFVAYAAVAGCAFLLRFLLWGRRRDAVGVVLGLALTGLFRPSDAIYAAVALTACVVVVRASWPRRIAAAALVMIGCAAGLAEWVIEAYTSYGGLSARIRGAQGENGGGGLHPGGAAAEARALAGPLLCRWTCRAHAPIGYQVWWWAGSVLVIAAVVVAVARRGARPMLTIVPVVVGLAMAAQYLVTVPYAAPRFLVPAYALLSLPCAAVLTVAVRRLRTSRLRYVACAVVTVVVAAQAVSQTHVITSRIAPPSRLAERSLSVDARDVRALGVRRPCLVLGQVYPNQQLAYALGCANTPTEPALVQQRLAAGTSAVWLRPTSPGPTHDVAWRPCVLPGATPSTSIQAFVSHDVTYRGAAKARRPAASAR